MGNLEVVPPVGHFNTAATLGRVAEQCLRSTGVPLSRVSATTCCNAALIAVVMSLFLPVERSLHSMVSCRACATELGPIRLQPNCHVALRLFFALQLGLAEKIPVLTHALNA